MSALFCHLFSVAFRILTLCAMTVATRIIGGRAIPTLMVHGFFFFLSGVVLLALLLRLVNRDAARTEAEVQADVRQLLLTAPFELVH